MNTQGGNMPTSGDGVVAEPRVIGPEEDRANRLMGLRPDLIDRLTPAHRVVLRGMLMGKTGRQMARELGRHPDTIAQHRSEIYRRLELKPIAGTGQSALAKLLLLFQEVPS